MAGEAERTVVADAAISLLLVDPSAIRRTGIGALLRRDARLLVVGDAESDEDACTLAARLRPAVCLVHADLVHADLQWLERLAAAAPPTAIVVYDADFTGDRISLLLAAGVHRVLPASTGSAQLLGVLHAVATTGRRERVVRAPAGTVADTEPDGAAAWAAHSGVELSEQQRLTLGLVIAGYSNREIAARLERSEHTVRAHLRHAFQRIGVRNRAQAAGWLIANGWYRADLSQAGDRERRNER